MMNEKGNYMKNPIPSSSFFATKTLGEIQAGIEELPKQQRAVASLVMMMTLNACNKLVEDSMNEQLV